jgi:hypothetical protein
MTTIPNPGTYVFVIKTGDLGVVKSISDIMDCSLRPRMHHIGVELLVSRKQGDIDYFHSEDLEFVGGAE